MIIGKIPFKIIYQKPSFGGKEKAKREDNILN